MIKDKQLIDISICNWSAMQLPQICQTKTLCMPDWQSGYKVEKATLMNDEAVRV